METQPRFNVNAALENWRNELAAQPQLSPDDRRELEKHLADSMTELRQRGLAEDEAFWLARYKIGRPQQLAVEFEKADPHKVWRERAFWMVALLLAFQIWVVISDSLLSLLSTYLQPGFSLYSLYPFPEIVVVYLPFALAIPLIATGRMAWLIRKFSFLIHSQAGLAFAALLLVIFSSFIAGLATYHFRSMMWHGNPPVSISLFTITTQNMIQPLIFIPLLCLFMPKKPKTPRRA